MAQTNIRHSMGISYDRERFNRRPACHDSKIATFQSSAARLKTHKNKVTSTSQGHFTNWEAAPAPKVLIKEGISDWQFRHPILT